MPQWPICYHNNLVMTECHPILRYLATRLGLYGQAVLSDDPSADYRADMTVRKLRGTLT